MGLGFWVPFGLLSLGAFVAHQQARERHTPEGAARARDALRGLEGWRRRYRPGPADFTPEGLRYFRAAYVLQALAALYAIGYLVLDRLAR